MIKSNRAPFQESEQKLKSELDKPKLIKRKGPALVEVEENIHLDEKSPLSPQNHINWRLESIKNISKREQHHSDYHLSVAFFCDEDTKIRLKQLFKDFVKQAQKEVGSCKNPDDVYHIVFDLF